MLEISSGTSVLLSQPASKPASCSSNRRRRRRRRRRTMKRQQQLQSNTALQNRKKQKTIAVDASKPAGSRANIPISAASRPVATSAAMLSRTAPTSGPAAAATSSMSQPVTTTWDPVAHIAHLLEQDKELWLSFPHINLCNDLLPTHQMLLVVLNNSKMENSTGHQHMTHPSRTSLC
ncbi:uncharacterized protein LOC126469921 isoform X2 [Schistocerca serialis cubense]|uniref:uncharacterized protein LOC126469921 isoform X2 n=1 Tax=Schistocerca serialis cubense TaxID=2023355 RepID=UPI00214E6630|nr:uncharacterized protein LOC126469921 isoform X2 [Schistocerca serialis cubense]